MESGLVKFHKLSNMYVHYLHRPKVCVTRNAYYRKTLPGFPEPLPKTPHPSDPREVLVFIHKYYGGIFVFVGLAVVISSIVIGIIWGKVGNPSIGWTVALSGGSLFVTYVTLVAMV
jgi:hypothetical protein